MKTRIMYITYDDMEFESKEECEKYEEEAKTILKELTTNYTYQDKDKNIIKFDESDDIEIEMNTYDNIWKNVEYVIIHTPLSEEALEWVNYQFGFEMPPNNPGKYKYDWKKWEWKKVG